MLKVCIEGWRGINHSYSIVNERQIIELSKLNLILKHKDVPYYNPNWNRKINNNGFNELDNKIIQSVKKPLDNEIFDVVYRISFPFNFAKSNSKNLFIFGTSEYQNINDLCVNFDLKNINNDDQVNIVTPSNWSKTGFLNAGIKKNLSPIPSAPEVNIIGKKEKLDVSKNKNIDNVESTISKESIKKNDNFLESKVKEISNEKEKFREINFSYPQWSPSEDGTKNIESKPLSSRMKYLEIENSGDKSSFSLNV